METTKFNKTFGLIILFVLLISVQQSKVFSSTSAPYNICYLINQEVESDKPGIFINPGTGKQDATTNEFQGGIYPGDLTYISDSLKKDQSKGLFFHFGFGSGVGTDGGIIGTEFALISANKWGGRISYNSSISKYKNLPEDYFRTGIRIFIPKNYVNIVTFNLLREFLLPQKNVDFGLEAGLSWISYSYTVIRENPNYDPNDIWNQNKYFKSHEKENTFGTTLRVSMGLLVSPNVGFEFALFTTINNVQPVTGLEIFVILGILKNK